MKKEKWEDSGKKLFSLKRSIIWSIPSIVLIVLVSFQAVIYVNHVFEKTQKQLLKDVRNVASQYATELDTELTQLGIQAKPMAALLSKVSGYDRYSIANSLQSMTENTVAFQVIYSSLKGNAVTSDGREVSIVKEEYYMEEPSDETIIQYADHDSISGGPAIVVSVPVKDEKEFKGYLILYYPTNQFETLFSSSEFSKMAFYALADNDGNVFSLDGYNSSMVEKGVNLFEKLSMAKFDDGNLENFKTHFTHRTSGYVYSSMNGEKKWLFYEPVEATNIMLCMGVDDSYLQKQLVKEMNVTYEFVAYLIGFIVLYILIMFTMFLVSGMKQRKNSPEKQYDGMTGLYNKNGAEVRITEYIENQSDSLAAFFVIDIDNFTKINETQGKTFGDLLLKSMGKQLRNKFREYDIVSRYERDQFVIFLKYFPSEELLMREAKHVAETFCNISFEKEQFEISTSIGCSVYPKDAKNVEELYQTANEAVKVAKAMGKDQMVFYEEIQPEEAFAETE